jgi:hypothetical protein
MWSGNLNSLEPSGPLQACKHNCFTFTCLVGLALSSITNNSLKNQCDNSEPKDARVIALFRMGRFKRWKKGCLLIVQEPFTQMFTYPMFVLQLSTTVAIRTYPSSLQKLPSADGECTQPNLYITLFLFQCLSVMLQPPLSSASVTACKSANSAGLELSKYSMCPVLSVLVVSLVTIASGTVTDRVTSFLSA